MTKVEFSQLLTIHQQWFPNSCAASGMEMLLKWHRIKEPGWFAFQKSFENQNIGWTQKDLFSEYGIQAKHLQCDLDTFYITFRNQSAQGRILLFSLPTAVFKDVIHHKWAAVGQCHVFVATMVDCEEVLVSKRFLDPYPFVIPDLKKTYDMIRQIDQTYTIDALTYELS